MDDKESRTWYIKLQKRGVWRKWRDSIQTIQYIRSTLDHSQENAGKGSEGEGSTLQINVCTKK